VVEDECQGEVQALVCFLDYFGLSDDDQSDVYDVGGQSRIPVSV